MKNWNINFFGGSSNLGRNIYHVNQLKKNIYGKQKIYNSANQINIFLIVVEIHHFIIAQTLTILGPVHTLH
jgi:hypothetical protein